MGFFVSKFDAPRLYNYMDALAHEQEVKPIRGKAECKPLGKRRNTHVTIRKGADESVMCRLYHTDVITYHKDGRIEFRLEGWASQSTMVFIREVLGVGAVIRNSMVWVQSAIPNLATVGWYALHSNGVNEFRRNGQGDLEFQNHTTFTKHTINRAGANNVRKMFKPFKNYLSATMRVRDAGFSHQEFGDVFGWVMDGKMPDYPKPMDFRRDCLGGVDEFIGLALSDDTQDRYKATLILVRSMGHPYRENWVVNAPLMLRRLDDFILYAHREECFDEVDVPLGEIARDPYEKFFSY